MYIDDPDFMEILANDAENTAEYLGKRNIRRQRAEINDLLESITLNRQKQANSRKLAIDQAINARKYDYPDYMNYRDDPYVNYINKRLYENGKRNDWE